MLRALFLALVLFTVGAVGYFWGSRAPSDDGSPKRAIEIKETPSVITALTRLSRLEGAALHMERVIDLREKQSRFMGLIEAEDAILLVAAGDVTAGVDLSGLRNGDVVVNEENKSVHITLPRAEIFQTRVDNERTYVHSRSTDRLAERQTELETKARREAERGFAEAARKAGLTERAEESVARTVRALVLSLGFDNVQVVFRQEARQAQ